MCFEGASSALCTKPTKRNLPACSQVICDGQHASDVLSNYVPVSIPFPYSVASVSLCGVGVADV